MKPASLKVAVNVEKTAHQALQQFATTLQQDHDLYIRQANFEWTEDEHNNIILENVLIVTETKPI